jgi:hypothetical protein
MWSKPNGDFKIYWDGRRSWRYRHRKWFRQGQRANCSPGRVTFSHGPFGSACSSSCSAALSIRAGPHDPHGRTWRPWGLSWGEQLVSTFVLFIDFLEAFYASRSLNSREIFSNANSRFLVHVKEKFNFMLLESSRSLLSVFLFFCSDLIEYL